jgi:hypothetical protein
MMGIVSALSMSKGSAMPAGSRSQKRLQDHNQIPDNRLPAGMQVASFIHGVG